MWIDKWTGLPEWMPNRTPLIDQIRAVTESVELTLWAMIPLENIQRILLYPTNAQKLTKGWWTIRIMLNQVPWFKVAEFDAYAEAHGYPEMSQKAKLIRSVIEPWANQNWLTYFSRDSHLTSSLEMIFWVMTQEDTKSKN